jgi:hypothetical protein
MTHVDELNVTAAQTGGKRVQRIPYDAVAILDTSCLQGLNNDLRYFLAH